MAAKDINYKNGKLENNPFAVFKSADVQLAIGVVGIIFMMVLPIHPFVLDVLLSLSISISILILLLSLYVKEPLEFSTFPTVLLLSTLFRLALNVATTKNILLYGAKDHVSHIVQSFGNFVIGGNFFVGFVIFIILVIINFIVITKGAGRVAEVSARFTLDAMPGKQMAIDAELSQNMIDRDEAKRRRAKVENEADFYGSMDGASKFVRGDAIAGIIITAVNILVGLTIGVIQYNLDFVSAAKKFTLLTVGDGLVSQIPALIISTAAGIVVTRAGGEGGLSNEIGGQFLLHPKAHYVCSALMAMLMLVPGMPGAPFLILTVMFFLLGRYSQKNRAKALTDLEQEKELKAQSNGKEESIESLLHLDTIALEVGVELVSLVDSQQDGEVLDRIVSARKQFAQDMGVIVPMVMIRDNIALRPDEYQILLKGNVIGRGRLQVRRFLAMDAGDVLEPIEGIRTKEPAYGLDAIWILPSQRDEASFRNYTVVNPATVIVTHLTKLIQESAADLIGRQEVYKLVEGLKQTNDKLVDEVIASDRLTLGDVVKVLQNLLIESVSIRDLTSIFETLADYCKILRNPDALTRYVRKALGRSIVRKYLNADGLLIVVSLDRALEDVIVAGITQNQDDSTSLSIEPEFAQRLLNKIAECMKSFEKTGTQPVLMCGARIRWDLRKLINRFIPGLTILAFDEIPIDIQTQTINTISF